MISPDEMVCGITSDDAGQALAEEDLPQSHRDAGDIISWYIGVRGILFTLNIAPNGNVSALRL